LPSSSIFYHFLHSSHKTPFIKHPPHTLLYLHKHFSIPSTLIYSPSQGIHPLHLVFGGLGLEEARRRSREHKERPLITW
jgi:hypothetical protein